MSFSCVKSSFNSFCSNEIIISHINNLTLISNFISFETCKFANLHILRLLQNNQPIPIFNQQFFYRCACLVSSFKSRKAKSISDIPLLKSFDIYKSSLPSDHVVPFRDNLARIINYMSKEFVTATINHLTLNFYKRFRTFIKHRYSDEDCKEVSKYVYASSYEGENRIILKYRNMLNNLPPYENNIKKDPSLVLKIYYKILRYNESHGLKVFSLLPDKRYNTSYITIDKNALIDILKDIGLYNKKKDVDYHWNKYFNISKYETENRKFRYFSTDGKYVSITLEVTRKQKKLLKEKKINYKNYDNIIGLDPGLRNLFVCSYNDTYDTIKCSSRQYYNDTLVNQTNFSKNNTYERNPDVLEYMRNLPSGKTSNLDTYLVHLKYCLKDYQKILQFHHENPFRKWKFTRWKMKKKVITDLCKKISNKNKITDKDNTIVGFGNWSNPHDSIIRGHRRGPVLELKKELAKWTKVIDVDEFRTSKLCCLCYKETEKMKYDGIRVNSVLRCKNNECKNIIDRDINGSNNILLMLERELKGKKRKKEFIKGNKLTTTLDDQQDCPKERE
jgi:transposase